MNLLGLQPIKLTGCQPSRFFVGSCGTWFTRDGHECCAMNFMHTQRSYSHGCRLGLPARVTHTTHRLCGHLQQPWDTHATRPAVCSCTLQRLEGQPPRQLADFLLVLAKRLPPRGQLQDTHLPAYTATLTAYLAATKSCTAEPGTAQSLGQRASKPVGANEVRALLLQLLKCAMPKPMGYVRPLVQALLSHEYDTSLGECCWHAHTQRSMLRGLLPLRLSMPCCGSTAQQHPTPCCHKALMGCGASAGPVECAELLRLAAQANDGAFALVRQLPGVASLPYNTYMAVLRSPHSGRDGRATQRMLELPQARAMSADQVVGLLLQSIANELTGAMSVLLK